MYHVQNEVNVTLYSDVSLRYKVANFAVYSNVCYSLQECLFGVQNE